MQLSLPQKQIWDGYHERIYRPRRYHGARVNVNAIRRTDLWRGIKHEGRKNPFFSFPGVTTVDLMGMSTMQEKG
jgi:hypothetical protein